MTIADLFPILLMVDVNEAVTDRQEERAGKFFRIGERALEKQARRGFCIK
jgi:hypothetical protein